MLYAPLSPATWSMNQNRSCANEVRRIRAIRWFQQTAGWTPRYTDSGVDKGYQPLCFGPQYLGARVATTIGVDRNA